MNAPAAPSLVARRSLPALVREKVLRAFAAGALSIDSDIQRIPYIGAWLASHIAEQVTGNPARATLRELLTYLSRPGDGPGFATTRSELVAGRVGLLCQNRRPNACVPPRRESEANERYHVRDSNKACSFALPAALLQALSQGDPHLSLAEGGGSVVRGLKSAALRVQTRATTEHGSAAASCPCKQAQGCHERGDICTWLPGAAASEGQCVPLNNQTLGFEGVPPFTGQKENPTQNPGLHRRGDYGPIRGMITRWRRPSLLGRISGGGQALAWTVPPRTVLE